jgi:transcriptional regulator with PAS, ATPase and Fis domain
MLVGHSPLMQELRVRAARIAGTNFTVLIEGESGAGKELVAREIHALSARRAGPFVPVNCAAIVDTLLEAELFGIEERTATGVKGRRGKFEQAHRGTLFLDEVGDLAPAAQAKLLRVLQDMCVERVGGQTSYHVEARVLAATNRSLRALVDAGRFRSDLYYRLAGVEVCVPPLRARREDIGVLVDHLAARHRTTRHVSFAASAIEALSGYDWPGNVRQLGRVLERAIALSPCDVITAADLPPEISREYGDGSRAIERRDDSLRAWTSRYVRLVLERCDNNKRRACEILDISYRTLKTHLDYDSARTQLTGAEVTAAISEAGSGVRQ